MFWMSGPSSIQTGLTGGKGVSKNYVIEYEADCEGDWYTQGGVDLCKSVFSSVEDAYAALEKYHEEYGEGDADEYGARAYPKVLGVCDECGGRMSPLFMSEHGDKFLCLYCKPQGDLE